MSATFDEKTKQAILADIQEMNRLGKLSDDDLVVECLRSEESDSLVVQEILNRWKPGWLGEQE